MAGIAVPGSRAGKAKAGRSTANSGNAVSTARTPSAPSAWTAISCAVHPDGNASSGPASPAIASASANGAPGSSGSNRPVSHGPVGTTHATPLRAAASRTPPGRNDSRASGAMIQGLGPGSTARLGRSAASRAHCPAPSATERLACPPCSNRPARPAWPMPPGSSAPVACGTSATPSRRAISAARAPSRGRQVNALRMPSSLIWPSARIAAAAAARRIKLPWCMSASSNMGVDTVSRRVERPVLLPRHATVP